MGSYTLFQKISIGTIHIVATQPRKRANCERLRVRLHHGDNRAKLMCYKEKKIFFQ
jgi:hypothetical protein